MGEPALQRVTDPEEIKRMLAELDAKDEQWVDVQPEGRGATEATGRDSGHAGGAPIGEWEGVNVPAAFVSSPEEALEVALAPEADRTPMQRIQAWYDKKALPPSVEAEPVTQAEAAATDALQGLGSSWEDEASAWARHPLDERKRAAVLQRLKERRDEGRRNYPKTTLAAGIGGALMGPGPGKLKALKQVQAGLKAGGRAVPAVARSAATGAASAAVDAAGAAEGGVEERLAAAQEGAETGALVGTTFGAAGRGVRAARDTKTVQAARKALKDKAAQLKDASNRLRARAAGLDLGDLRKLDNRYPGGVAGFVDDMKKEGIGKTRLLPASTARIAQDATEALDRAGPKMADVKKQMVSAGNVVDAEEAARRFGRKVVQPLAATASGQRPANTAGRIADRLAERGKVTFDEAHFERQVMDDAASNAANTTESARRALRRELSDVMQEAADSEGLGSQWREANRGYRVAKTIEDAAQDQANRAASGRQAFSMGDMVAASGGGSLAAGLGANIGGAGGGATLGIAANRLLRGGREHSISAGITDRLSNLLHNTPDRLGSYADILQRAAERGNLSLAATHYRLLQTDSAYRKQWDEAQSDEDEDKDEGDTDE